MGGRSMSDARRSVTGREAKAAGDAFELFLEYQHATARRLGILAHIEHNEPHFKYVGGKWIAEAPGVADYTATLDRSGLTVAIEAKSTKKDRLARSAVSPKQQEHLDAVARAGGLALLAVEFRYPVPTTPFWMGAWGVLDYYRRYAVPWLETPWQVLRTAESVNEEDLLRGGWRMRVMDAGHSGDCYLERWHSRGTPSTAPKSRRYARE